MSALLIPRVKLAAEAVNVKMPRPTSARTLQQLLLELPLEFQFSSVAFLVAAFGTATLKRRKGELIKATLVDQWDLRRAEPLFFLVAAFGTAT